LQNFLASLEKCVGAIDVKFGLLSENSSPPLVSEVGNGPGLDMYV